MSTSRRLLTALLLGIMLGSPALAADRDPHGLGQALTDRLVARRRLASIHSTDFQGTDLGCIVLPRYELRPYGYPGHAFLCEAAVSGEVLGAVLNKRGVRICDIAGAYVADDCYDFDICGYAEQLCVVN
jgi:hypothetical protein